MDSLLKQNTSLVQEDKGWPVRGAWPWMPRNCPWNQDGSSSIIYGAAGEIPVFLSSEQTGKIPKFPFHTGMVVPCSTFSYGCPVLGRESKVRDHRMGARLFPAKLLFYMLSLPRFALCWGKRGGVCSSFSWTMYLLRRNKFNYVDNIMKNLW